MDTKSKKYRYSVWFKLFAILLCIAGMITLGFGLLRAPYFELAVQNDDFKESTRSKDLLLNAYLQVSDIAFTYKNEEYIKSGEAISSDAIANRRNELFFVREDNIRRINNKYGIYEPYNEELTQSEDDSSKAVQAIPKDESNQLFDVLHKERDKEIQEVLKKYDEDVKNIKSVLINEQLAQYHSMLESLNQSNGIFYTVLEGDKVTLSNVNDYSLDSAEPFYKSLSLFDKVTKNSSLASYPNLYHSAYQKDYYHSASDFPNDAVVFLGLSLDKYNSERTAYNKDWNEGILGLKMSIIGTLAFLLGLIYIIYSSGKRVDKDGIHLIFIDHVYLDIALVVSSLAILACFSALNGIYSYYYRNGILNDINLFLSYCGAIIAIGTFIGITFICMFSKKVKRHEVIRHTLIFRILSWIKNTFIFKVCPWIIGKIKNTFTTLSSVFDKSPLTIRLVLIFVAYSVLILISISLICSSAYSRGGTAFIIALLGLAMFFGVNIAAIYFLLKTFKIIKNIKDGAERIRAGELSYNIPVEGIAELRQLSETINKIADGLNTAVSSQVKSERMKAELITNVSHDLKTPLTSIITYVDLLKNEGLQSENADKYLGIIDTKSQRLKALTEDLFEAAKASSGNITVNFERLDVVSLINQGLGELSDKIEASGLTFRATLPSEKLFVNADGKLLWRVIENLLSNVFKYALPNSRVYIEAFDNAGTVKIIIKNISAYELNVNEEELMERFKRGDSSRHSEGSGLGLSIAKSLTELQGGSFNIEIDGDLFKAKIELVGCE